MLNCSECNAENVTVYSCECCGTYACSECSEDGISHCPGCTSSMEEVYDER